MDGNEPAVRALQPQEGEHLATKSVHSQYDSLGRDACSLTVLSSDLADQFQGTRRVVWPTSAHPGWFRGKHKQALIRQLDRARPLAQRADIDYERKTVREGETMKGEEQERRRKRRRWPLVLHSRHIISVKRTGWTSLWTRPFKALTGANLRKGLQTSLLNVDFVKHIVRKTALFWSHPGSVCFHQ